VLPRAAGKRVLDVGSGEGYGPALLAGRAAEVVGVDYSPAAVEHARSAYPLPNLRFDVMDANRLDPALADFDLVTCFEVLEHVDSPEALVRSLSGALRPDGVLVLSTPNETVDRLFRAVGGHRLYEYHVSLVSPAELRRLMRRHFTSVVLYGQSERGSLLHAVLKGLDVFNLRHRLVRSQHVQIAVGESLGKPSERTQDFRFSRLLVRQSPAIVVVARAPRR
jgi:SAM-dependent methyltransferase